MWVCNKTPVVETFFNINFTMNGKKGCGFVRDNTGNHHPQVCQGRKSLYWGMVISPLMTGILIMGPYKPLRTWVDVPIPTIGKQWEFRPDRTY